MITALVWWARQRATNRSRRLILYLCASVLLLAVAPAWGSPGRMVLANRKLHRIVRGSDNQIVYTRGHPKDPDNGDWSFVEEITLSTLTGSWPCRTWIPTYDGGGALGGKPAELFAAEGLAVYDNKIFVAFTADADCNNHNLGMSAYVAAFDLRSTPDFPDGRWIVFDNGKMYWPVANGSVRTDTPSQGWGSGAAITVFNNQLYVFTNKGVYTSGDGLSGWTYHDLPFADTHPIDEPLDAVTINAPDGPRILIVYGTMSGKRYNYDRLDALDWNPAPGGGVANGYTYINIGAPSGGVRARVSLTVGTKKGGDAGYGDDKLANGALAPAVQLFLQTGEQFTTSTHNPARNAEYVYSAVGAAPGGAWGTWRWDSTRILYFDHTNPSLMVYPWPVSQCDESIPKRMAQSLRIVLLGGFNWWTTKTPLAYVSDHLVPEDTSQISKCTDVPSGTGTNTGDPTGDPDDIRKHYWSLLGVIMGPPPFSDNGLLLDAIPNYDAIGALSNVFYEKSTEVGNETTHEMTNEVMLSVGRSVSAGLGKKFQKSRGFDATYKHAWEQAYGTKSTETITVLKTVGTSLEGLGDLGHYGWALFGVPVVRVQNWKVYAYDYKYQSADGGTALDQELQTISSSGASLVSKRFDLVNPGASEPLLAGMANFAEATDLDFWGPHLPWNWQNDERWETVFGDGTLADTKINTLDSDSGSDVSYEIKTETMNSHGETNEVDINVSSGMSSETRLGGFSSNLTAGYSGTFKWNTTDTTGTGTKVTASLKMPTCSSVSNCVSSLLVQPYWLKARTGMNVRAPWVPNAYQMQEPWCLTWKIVPKNATLIMAGNPVGMALPPANAFGRIVNGGGGGDQGGDSFSHYFIQGGRLAWANSQGAEQRIPMTADDFMPSQGVKIEVAGGSWSSSGNGSWKRSGDIWTFQTNPGAQPRVTLSLDFGSATYDVQLQKANLSGYIPAGVANSKLILVVNQRYTFYTDLHHDIDITWRWSKPPAAIDNTKMQVASFQGRYNSATQSGNMSITGTLPAQLPEFGDLAVNINDHQYVVPLILLDDFQKAFETGGVVKYAKEGMIVVVDFGKKRWSATFNNKAFHRLLAPRWGTVRAQIMVGGVPWITEDDPIVEYSANLTLRH
jgi:hypothetical protein